MTRKILVTVTMIILAVCLVSGGCSSVDSNKLDSWKDMFKIAPGEKDAASPSSAAPNIDIPAAGEEITVKLYFVNSQTKQLEAEERSIPKVEGIARQTMQELIKGPSSNELQAVVPAGTELLDINIKPDGLCILDLSSEVNEVSSAQQGEMMVQAIANTMGQFPSVKEVSFLIEGQRVNVLGKTVDITEPVYADYTR